MGISLHGGSVGQPGVGSSTRDLERWLKRGLEGGLPWWGPWRIGKKVLEMGISFHTGPNWGCWKGAHLTGTLRDG
jgi:hypothetical protein